MNILLASAAPGIPVLGPSGSSAHLRGVAQAMLRAGHSLRVVAARESDRRGVHGQLPVPIETAPVPGWPSWLGRLRERREVLLSRRLRAVALSGPAPQLVYERWSLFSDLGEGVRDATGAPWVLEVNAPLAQERERFEELRDPSFARRWQRRVLPRADRLIAVSPWIARWLVEEIGVDARRVRVVPNGAASSRGDRAATRAELGVEGRFVLGFLGSMKPWHGAERVAELVARLPDAVGLLVGDGAPAPPPGVEVIRVGQVSAQRAADLVAAMDVGLAPYPPDAPPWFCPLKVLDYRAQGTPVVASAVGELESLVGEGGSLVPAGDLEAMAAACASWRGRRADPWLRSWDAVLEECLEGLGS